MSLIKVQQNTPEWLNLRLGKCTGSRVKDALQLLRNGEPGAKRKNYLIELVTQRMTGFAVDHYVSDAMIWGSEQEKYARAAYEVVTGNDVDLVGMYVHPNIADFSSSPDGIIGADGLVEIKCPQSTTHVEWMFDGVVPEEHKLQLYAEMACSERQWVDFVSFDPRLLPRHRVLIKRLERDDVVIAAMEKGIKEFLFDVESAIKELNRLNPPIDYDLPTVSGLPRDDSGAVDLSQLADQLSGDATP